jgi:hypothetical protein
MHYGRPIAKDVTQFTLVVVVAALRYDFLFAGRWLATLHHLHMSLFASDVSYCKAGENKVLVIWDFLKSQLCVMYDCKHVKYDVLT